MTEIQTTDTDINRSYGVDKTLHIQRDSLLFAREEYNAISQEQLTHNKTLLLTPSKIKQPQGRCQNQHVLNPGSYSKRWTT